MCLWGVKLAIGGGVCYLLGVGLMLVLGLVAPRRFPGWQVHAPTPLPTTPAEWEAHRQAVVEEVQAQEQYDAIRREKQVRRRQLVLAFWAGVVLRGRAVRAIWLYASRDLRYWGPFRATRITTPEVRAAYPTLVLSEAEFAAPPRVPI